MSGIAYNIVVARKHNVLPIAYAILEHGGLQRMDKTITTCCLSYNPWSKKHIRQCLPTQTPCLKLANTTLILLARTRTNHARPIYKYESFVLLSHCKVVTCEVCNQHNIMIILVCKLIANITTTLNE